MESGDSFSVSRYSYMKFIEQTRYAKDKSMAFDYNNIIAQKSRLGPAFSCN